MSRKESLNHHIEYIKTTLNFLLISFFGICAFVFVNIDTLDIIKLTIATFGGIAVILAWLILLIFYKKNCEELEKL